MNYLRVMNAIVFIVIALIYICDSFTIPRLDASQSSNIANGRSISDLDAALSAELEPLTRVKRGKWGSRGSKTKTKIKHYPGGTTVIKKTKYKSGGGFRPGFGTGALLGVGGGLLIGSALSSYRPDYTYIRQHGYRQEEIKGNKLMMTEINNVTYSQEHQHYHHGVNYIGRDGLVYDHGSNLRVSDAQNIIPFTIPAAQLYVAEQARKEHGTHGLYRVYPVANGSVGLWEFSSISINERVSGDGLRLQLNHALLTALIFVSVFAVKSI